MSPHLADEDYAAILDGAAAGPVLEAAERHAAECDECRALLACAAKIRASERGAEAREPTLPSALQRTAVGGPAALEAPELAAGATIGRYRLLEPLGRGGMGIVYAAIDETLQRRVAIKLLARRQPGDPEGKRLLREARAMATVDHPNVVTVHDSGLHEGRVYVVMDLVVGGDLRDWLREQRRAWREVVEVWLAAAKGLHAVHAAGLVHRDFKPANVLVGEDGRVRVSDFGLVGMTAAEDSIPDRASLEQVIGDDRTQTGVVLGTPRYMSPEQLRGRRVDASTDQFSFCVALWEALSGEHPFGDGDGYERLGRMKAEELEPFPPGRDVPPRIVGVLRRGLTTDPDRRYQDMRQLAGALSKAADAGRRARRFAVMSIVVFAALGAGAALGRDDAPAPCDPPPQGDFDGIWDDDTRERLRHTVTAQPGGAERWARFASLVGDYTKQWSEAREEACLATRERAEVSEAMLDRRMACLERGRAALTAIVETRAASPSTSGSGPVALALRLPDLSGCSDLEALSTVAPRPGGEETRAKIAALEAERARVNVLRYAGETAEAMRRIDAALEEARPLDWAPLTAALLNQRALILLAESPRAAVDAWREAYAVAVAAGQLVSYEVGIDGIRPLLDAGRLEEAAFLIEVVAAHAERLGGEPRRGALATNRMYLEVRRGNVDKAEEYALEAVESFIESEDHVAITQAYVNLGGLLAGGGRIEESFVYTRRAREASEVLYGRHHPQTLRARHNEAYAAFAAGDTRVARALAEQNLAALTDLELPSDQAKALTLLGEIAELGGRFAEAVDYHEQGIAALERIGATPGDLGVAVSRLGRAQGDGGDPDTAVVTLERALALLPEDDPSYAVIRIDTQALLSVALREAGRHQEGFEAARLGYERALLLGPDDGVDGYHAYARALAATGRHEEALEVLDPAVEAAADWVAAPQYHAILLADRAELLEALDRPEAARADWKRAAELGDSLDERVGDPWDRVDAHRDALNLE